MSSFDNKKELRFVITLGNGQTFQGGSSNQITLEGYRAIVNIDRGGGMMAGIASLMKSAPPQTDKKLASPETLAANLRPAHR